MKREEMFEKIRMGEVVNGFSQLWLVDLIREHYDTLEYQTCKNCKYWVKASNPSLMKCSGSNGCEIVGGAFYCSNWEKKR